MQFRWRYLPIALAIFVILVLIESQFDGGFIRFTVGDALVVVMLYAVLMTFSTGSRMTIAGVTLLIAYAVEMTQSVDLVTRLGMTPNRVTNAVFGTTFSWKDIAAYTVGIVVALLVEVINGTSHASD